MKIAALINYSSYEDTSVDTHLMKIAVLINYSSYEDSSIDKLLIL